MDRLKSWLRKHISKQALVIGIRGEHPYGTIFQSVFEGFVAQNKVRIIHDASSLSDLILAMLHSGERVFYTTSDIEPDFELVLSYDHEPHRKLLKQNRRYTASFLTKGTIHSAIVLETMDYPSVTNWNTTLHGTTFTIHFDASTDASFSFPVCLLEEAYKPAFLFSALLCSILHMSPNTKSNHFRFNQYIATPQHYSRLWFFNFSTGWYDALTDGTHMIEKIAEKERMEITCLADSPQPIPMLSLFSKNNQPVFALVGEDMKTTLTELKKSGYTMNSNLFWYPSLQQAGYHIPTQNVAESIVIALPSENMIQLQSL